MKRKRAFTMASSWSSTVKPSRVPEEESVRCWESKTASSNRTRPQIQSRSRRGSKTRNINDVLKDERSKISGINRILGTPIPVRNNLTWRLLKSHMRIESFYCTKLHSALNAIHECFEPSKDPYTNRDIAEDIVFDLESDSELNLRGFYTVVLERRDDDDGHQEMIGAATVRINKGVAEVPLVATRPQFRRLGMCRILMNELENRLMEFGIESASFWSPSGFLFGCLSQNSNSSFLSRYEIFLCFLFYFYS
ncbi:increased DNA methylation 1 isoform X1 [Rosa chinensis]|uniref:increased DNA methylation 1-like isoform X1 n=1 Tax=Rosa chinensis TaxID=74649 RepID=UPI000D0873B6|nr:increased DNA methylation 1-like isoform X1 [Rosa chinensis]XP_040367020.1 increased DNA methylation 1 isoform X1 [Rosa chinensis]